MRIDVIDNIEDFERIRGDWDRVYMQDTHAQYFLSWGWLRRYLAKRKRWFMLALRESEPESPYVAFFPLRLMTSHDKITGLFKDYIVMAGSHAADYTGILTDPEYEEHAIRGFGLFLRNQNWANVVLDNFGGPTERCDALVRMISGPDVKVRVIPHVGKDNIDQSVCPFITLPDSWESYLETKLSGQTRQKMRRFLRQVESDPAYSITVATPETIHGDLDTLFNLWRVRWAAAKGEHVDTIISSTRDMLMDTFRAGDLFVAVLRYNGRPLGALANILDRKKKTVLFYVTGRDEEWKTPSPGLVLHGYAIRHAISEGFRSYDFLRGNETYKYAFGVEERPLHCLAVRSVNGRNRNDLLNIRSISHVYDLARKLYRQGEKHLAQAAFEQVVAACPKHVGARFGLAQLAFDGGLLAEAEIGYRQIADELKDPIPVLFHLGDAQLGQRKFQDAIKTFGTVIRRQPNCGAAHYKRAAALLAVGRKPQAIKAFEILAEMHSDDPVHAVCRQKAIDALRRLTAPREQTLPSIHPRGFPLALVDRPIRFAKDTELSRSTSICDSARIIAVREGRASDRNCCRVPAAVTALSAHARNIDAKKRSRRRFPSGASVHLLPVDTPYRRLRSPIM